MQLDAPALVRGVLREHGLAHGIAHRDLPSGIAAQLAAEHADRIAALLQGAVVPALDGREAEADRLAGDRMPPCARGERRRSAARSSPLRGGAANSWPTTREAQVRPPLVDPSTSCLLRSRRRSLDQRARDRREHRIAGDEHPLRIGEGRQRACIATPPVIGRDEAQQRDQPIGVVAGEALEQRCRQAIVIDRRHEGGARRPARTGSP